MTDLYATQVYATQVHALVQDLEDSFHLQPINGQLRSAVKSAVTTLKIWRSAYLRRSPRRSTRIA
jgi:hypothetical protein